MGAAARRQRAACGCERNKSTATNIVSAVYFNEGRGAQKDKKGLFFTRPAWPYAGGSGVRTKRGKSAMEVVSTVARAPPEPTSVPFHLYTHVALLRKGKYTDRDVAPCVSTGPTKKSGPYLRGCVRGGGGRVRACARVLLRRGAG